MVLNHLHYTAALVHYGKSWMSHFRHLKHQLILSYGMDETGWFH